MSGDDGDWREAAREHITEGRPDEALALFRRHHADSRGVPALAGVRLTAWLADWVELGRTHPPALDALRAERRAAAQRLRGVGHGTGSRGLAAVDDFAEVVAISSHLGEPDYPVELFADLDAHNPDGARDCATPARRLLVRAGRYDLARRYLNDPTDAVARVAAAFEQRLTRGFMHAPEGMRETLRSRTVDDYLSGVREVMAVLSAVGEDELAEQVRRQAIDAVPWAHVRDDVEHALAR